MSQRHRIVLWASLLSLLALWGLTYDFGFRWPDFGSLDWIAYWSVTRGLWLGNGYFDVEWLKQLQTGVGYAPIYLGTQPTEVWPAHNPPPLLLLLVPFGALPFSNSILAWMIFVLALPVLAAFQFNRCLPTPLPAWVLLYLLASFTPFIEILGGGQVVTVLTTCLVFAWLAQRHQQSYAAGILLLPLALKPHIFVVSATLLLLVAYRRRHWATFVSPLVLLVLLTATVSLLDPAWITKWRNVATPVEWPSFVPADVLAQALGWPQWVPLLTIPLAVLFALWRYRHTTEVTPHILAESTLFSYLLSPFAVHAELFVWLPAVLWVGSRMWQERLRLPLLAIVTVSLHLLVFNLFRTWLYITIFLLLWAWMAWRQHLSHAPRFLPPPTR